MSSQFPIPTYFDFSTNLNNRVPLNSFFLKNYPIPKN